MTGYTSPCFVMPRRSDSPTNDGPPPSLGGRWLSSNPSLPQSYDLAQYCVTPNLFSQIVCLGNTPKIQLVQALYYVKRKIRQKQTFCERVPEAFRRQGGRFKWTSAVTRTALACRLAEGFKTHHISGETGTILPAASGTYNKKLTDVCYNSIVCT